MDRVLGLCSGRSGFRPQHNKCSRVGFISAVSVSRAVGIFIDSLGSLLFLLGVKAASEDSSVGLLRSFHPWVPDEGLTLTT